MTRVVQCEVGRERVYRFLCLTQGSERDAAIGGRARCSRLVSMVDGASRTTVMSHAARCYFCNDTTSETDFHLISSYFATELEWSLI